jgi:hypothetical protein
MSCMIQMSCKWIHENTHKICHNKIVFGMLNTNGLDKINFFVKLFVVFLYSTKNNFFPIQDCSREEIFVSIKGIGQACPILYTRINLVDLG